MAIIKKVFRIFTIFLLMAAWSQPTLALSAKGLQTLQVEEYAESEVHDFTITIEKSSPLQTLLLRWLGVDAYSRLLSFPQYVTLESWAAGQLAQHF